MAVVGGRALALANGDVFVARQLVAAQYDAIVWHSLFVLLVPVVALVAVLAGPLVVSATGVRAAGRVAVAAAVPALCAAAATLLTDAIPEWPMFAGLTFVGVVATLFVDCWNYELADFRGWFGRQSITNLVAIQVSVLAVLWVLLGLSTSWMPEEQVVDSTGEQAGYGYVFAEFGSKVRQMEQMS